MSDVVRAALVQTAWTGDKASMIDSPRASRSGGRLTRRPSDLLPRALLPVRSFCQVQDATFYDYAGIRPEGPTTQRFMALAAELNMVMILPVYEMEQEGVLYNTRRGHRRRRNVTSANTARRTSPR